MRGREVRADRDAGDDAVLPLRELQEALGQRRHDEPPSVVERGPGSLKGTSSSRPSSRPRAVRSPSAVCAGRTSSGAAGRTRRPAASVRARSTSRSTSGRARTPGCARWRRGRPSRTTGSIGSRRRPADAGVDGAVTSEPGQVHAAGARGRTDARGGVERRARLRGRDGIDRDCARLGARRRVGGRSQRPVTPLRRRLARAG